MATASVTHTFTNGTSADAVQVNTNFTDLVNFLNNSVIHKDGSKAFTANVSQPTTPTTNDHLTRKGYVDTEAAKLIPKSIVDAAGDLLVGTAADTVGRLAIGSNAQVLTVVSSAPAWAAVAVLPSPALVGMDGTAIPKVSNGWYPAWGGTTPSSPAAPAPAANILEFCGPFYVSDDFAIDNLGVYISSIGTGFNIRMGLYTGHASTGAPDALVVESSGQAAVASNNSCSITQTTLLRGKLYWLAIVTSASTGNMYHSANSTDLPLGAPWANPYIADSRKYNQSHTYGALPATATPVAVAVSTSPAGIPLLFAQAV